MGYVTIYTLEFEELPPNFDLEELEFFMFKKQKGCDFMYPFTFEDEYFDGDGECKWYNHDEDMAVLSKEFPTIVFKLSGDGEEADDIWTKYYKNGKKQEANIVITLEPFDENKLV
jgi:hypothetical protein